MTDTNPAHDPKLVALRQLIADWLRARAEYTLAHNARVVGVGLAKLQMARIRAARALTSAYGAYLGEDEDGPFTTADRSQQVAPLDAMAEKAAAAVDGIFADYHQPKPEA